jgi:hypothetical protein
VRVRWVLGREVESYMCQCITVIYIAYYRTFSFFFFPQWLPHRKGLVNGCVVAGFGGGAFIFDQIQTAYINPHNLSPDLTVNGNK